MFRFHNSGLPGWVRREYGVVHGCIFPKGQSACQPFFWGMRKGVMVMVAPRGASARAPRWNCFCGSRWPQRRRLPGPPLGQRGFYQWVRFHSNGLRGWVRGNHGVVRGCIASPEPKTLANHLFESPEAGAGHWGCAAGLEIRTPNCWTATKRIAGESNPALVPSPGINRLNTLNGTTGLLKSPKGCLLGGSFRGPGSSIQSATPTWGRLPRHAVRLPFSLAFEKGRAGAWLPEWQ